jgi:ankyrin repeat protein
MWKATPLMMAAYGGSDAAVRYLIAEHGVGLDSVSVQCFTALMIAVMCGRYDTVQTLFLLGASANVTDAAGNSPLLWAVRNGHGDVVGLLLSTCAASSSYRGPNGMTALCVAAVLGRIDIVRELVEATPTDARLSDSVGRTPLMYAAMRARRCGDGTAGQRRGDCEGAGLRRQDRADVRGRPRTARV